MALTTSLINQYISTQTGFTVDQLVALRKLFAEIETDLTAVETDVSTLIDTNGLDQLVLGDLSGAANTNQLTFNSGNSNWVPGAAADGS